MRIERIYLLIILSLSSITSYGLTFIIDGSGSMQGFSRTRALRVQVEEISQAVSPHDTEDRIVLFKSDDTKSLELLDIGLSDLNETDQFNGKFTLLGKMANMVFESATDGNYIIITDNVEDDNSEMSDTVNFYDQLMISQNISSVDISPQFLRFNGNPCRGDRKHYSGNCGLLIYFVNVGSSEVHSIVRNKLLKKLVEIEYSIFHVRPFDSNHLKLSSPEVNKSPFEIYSKQGKYHLRMQVKNQSVPTLQIDKLNKIKFSIIMQSLYDYIGIQKDTSVKINNFIISIDGSPIKMQKPRMKISPSKLSEHLEKGGMQKFEAEIILKPVEPSLIQRIKAMFDPKRCEVSFDLVLGTSENSLYMVEETRRQFFTPNISAYDKIYSDVDMISYFNPQDNRIVLPVNNEDIPSDNRTQVKLMYDNMSLFLIMLLIIGSFVGLCFFLYCWFQSPEYYYISVEEKQNNEIVEYKIRKFLTINTELFSIKRKLSTVTIKLNSSECYLKDSIFSTIDLPVKVYREVIVKNTQNVIKIYMDKYRRKND